MGRDIESFGGNKRVFPNVFEFPVAIILKRSLYNNAFGDVIKTIKFGDLKFKHLRTDLFGCEQGRLKQV